MVVGWLSYCGGSVLRGERGGAGLRQETRPGYHDAEAGRWVSRVFRKYLFINAYSLDDSGLKLCNDLSERFPMILPFTSDPFDVSRDADFLTYNQFDLPARYRFLAAPIRDVSGRRTAPGPAVANREARASLDGGSLLPTVTIIVALLFATNLAVYWLGRKRSF